MIKKLGRLRKNKKGISLAEVVVAIAVVSIVFAATMGAIVSSYTTIIGNKTVETASMEAQSIADTIISTIEGIDNDADINKAVNSSLAAGNTYDGLKIKTGAAYVDRIADPIAEFPNSSITDDCQFTIQPVSGLETSKVGSLGNDFDGYKVSVAVLSSHGYIIASAMTTHSTI